MKQPLILIGGGGHCVSCIDIVELSGKFEIIGILDNNKSIGGKILKYDIIGTDEEIGNLVKEIPNYLITVGQIKSSHVRKAIYDKVKKVGGNLPIIISPLAYVSAYAKIDEGSIIMHHAFINAKATIGKCAIINSKALIEHEVTIGDFCHISTGSVINGQTKIGKYCFIGSNSVISNNLQISSEIIVSAGSQVMQNLDISGTYIGHPLIKIL